MNTFVLKRRFATLWEAHARDWAGSLVILPLAIWALAKHGDYTFLDAFDLVIHEAGHFFFSLFGRFITIAGGTLMQLFLPALLVWHFRKLEYRFGVQLSLFWLGQNCINISVYAADARTRALPLLGGNRSGHDWWNMLRMTDLLEYDQVIGGLFVVAAISVFLLSIGLPRIMR